MPFYIFYIYLAYISGYTSIKNVKWLKGLRRHQIFVTFIFNVNSLRISKENTIDFGYQLTLLIFKNSFQCLVLPLTMIVQKEKCKQISFTPSYQIDFFEKKKREEKSLFVFILLFFILFS